MAACLAPLPGQQIQDRPVTTACWLVGKCHDCTECSTQVSVLANVAFKAEPCRHHISTSNPLDLVLLIVANNLLTTSLLTTTLDLSINWGLFWLILRFFQHLRFFCMSAAAAAAAMAHPRLSRCNSCAGGCKQRHQARKHAPGRQPKAASQDL